MCYGVFGLVTSTNKFVLIKEIIKKKKWKLLLHRQYNWWQRGVNQVRSYFACIPNCTSVSPYRFFVKQLILLIEMANKSSVAYLPLESIRKVKPYLKFKRNHTCYWLQRARGDKSELLERTRVKVHSNKRVSWPCWRNGTAYHITFWTHYLPPLHQHSLCDARFDNQVTVFEDGR